MSQSITTSTYDAALDVVSHGWVVIPVHAVDEKQAGRCTCRRAKCPHPGKHPWEKSWQESRYISYQDCYAIWVDKYIGSHHLPTLLGHDVDINVGILTGSPSRIAIIDIDPRNGGNETLAELEKEHGPLPRTRTVKSGSDGRHYYFQLPEGMSLPSCKFGDGVDFLADGRMVIAPGSTSATGTYEIYSNVDLHPILEWAIDLSRKSDRSTSTDIVMAADLPCHDELSPYDQMRCTRYAMKVIEDECEAYQRAGWGDGGYRLYVACCNILEILQSPWSGMEPAYARKRLETARAQRYRRAQDDMKFDNGQLPDEVDSTWRSAARKVAGKGRALPIDNRDDGVIMPPFEFGPATESTRPNPFLQPPDPNIFDEEVTESVITQAETVAWEAAQRHEMAVREAIDRQEAWDEAKRRRAGKGAQGQVTQDAVAALLAKMLTPDDLDKLPNPQPLIVDVLDLNSESWLIAAPGCFKSFLALDWAAHVGRGMDWQGLRTTQGLVIYIVAEGSKGIKLRKKAWCETYGHMENILFLPEPVQVTDELGWEVLIETCRQLEPVMIVLDTQARITVGLNENTSEMSVLIDAVRRMRAATGACVLVVHHTGRNGQDARGHSSLDGAQDSEIKVVRPEGPERRNLTAQIVFDKQKDSSESIEFYIKMREHDWGRDPVTDRRLSSLSIKPLAPFVQPEKKVPEWLENLTPNQAIILDAMRQQTDESGITRPELIKLINERADRGVGKHLANTSVRTALIALKKKLEKGRPVVIEKGARFTLSEHLDD